MHEQRGVARLERAEHRAQPLERARAVERAGGQRDADGAAIEQGRRRRLRRRFEREGAPDREGRAELEHAVHPRVEEGVRLLHRTGRAAPEVAHLLQVEARVAQPHQACARGIDQHAAVAAQHRRARAGGEGAHEGVRPEVLMEVESGHLGSADQ